VYVSCFHSCKFFFFKYKIINFPSCKKQSFLFFLLLQIFVSFYFKSFKILARKQFEKPLFSLNNDEEEEEEEEEEDNHFAFWFRFFFKLIFNKIKPRWTLLAISFAIKEAILFCISNNRTIIQKKKRRKIKTDKNIVKNDGVE